MVRIYNLIKVLTTELNMVNGLNTFAIKLIKGGYIMTQLTVSVEDVSKLEQIKQAISLIRGVSSVTLKRQRKTGMERAVEDIQKGRIFKAENVEDLINQCKA